MICKNCGSEVDDRSTFCFTCGAKIEKSNMPSEMNQNEPIAEKDSSSFNKSKDSGWTNFGKIRDSAFNFSKSTREFVENSGNKLVSNFKSDDVHFEKYAYHDALAYIRKNNSSKIAFPASDSQTKDNINKLLSSEVIGTGAGLVGTAATIGLIGTTLGTGLIVVGAGALIGGVISSNYEKMSWVLSDLFIKDDELIISGKFSISFDEIKHVSTKIIDDNEIVALTLKDQAIEFKTYNACALKTVIDEKRGIDD